MCVVFFACSPGSHTLLEHLHAFHRGFAERQRDLQLETLEEWQRMVRAGEQMKLLPQAADYVSSEGRAVGSRLSAAGGGGVAPVCSRLLADSPVPPRPSFHPLPPTAQEHAVAHVLSGSHAYLRGLLPRYLSYTVDLLPKKFAVMGRYSEERPAAGYEAVREGPYRAAGGFPQAQACLKLAYGTLPGQREGPHLAYPGGPYQGGGGGPRSLPDRPQRCHVSCSGLYWTVGAKKTQANREIRTPVTRFRVWGDNHYTMSARLTQLQPTYADSNCGCQIQSLE